MPKLLFHGNDTITKYKAVSLQTIANWLKPLKTIAFDTETNVTDSILDKELKVISMADVEGETAVVLEWDYLSHSVQQSLLEVIKRKKCIIQNVAFDYQVLKKYDCVLEDVEDTMLAEKELNNGFSADEGYTGLQAIYQRRLEIDISKAEQLSFGEGGPYSDSQIQYAALDVIHLGKIWKQQMQEMKNLDKKIKQRGNRGIKKSYWWQKEFIKVAADMESYGFNIDKDKWYAIEDEVRPIYEKELGILNDLVLRDYRDYLLANGHLYEKDTFDGNIWTSSARKLAILEQMFPGIEKTSQAELKKYLRDNDPSFPDELVKSLNGKKWLAHEYPTLLNDKYAVIKLLLRIKEEGVKESLDQFLLDSFREFLIEKGWLIPAGELQFNWASQQQRLRLFQELNPHIEKTGKDYLEELDFYHPIIDHYLKWGDTEYKLKMFGKNFYDKHVELDGKFRTRFNIALKTGRLSSVNPNALNIPRDKVYRKAVIPHEERVLVGADFDGEELKEKIA